MFRSLFMMAGAAVLATGLGAAETMSPEMLKAELAFTFMDKNGDGKLTKEEAGNASWFTRIERKDSNFVTREEWRTAAGLLLKRGGTTARVLPGTPDDSPVATAEPVRQGPKLARAADVGVGRLIPDVKFTDVSGKSGKLSDYKSSKALVIALTSTSCPVARKYVPTLVALEKEFATQGVKILYVNPTSSDTAKDIQTLLKDQGLTGRYVHDKEGKLITALGAATTTEVFVLDAARTLAFRGAIDDQYGLGYSLEAARHNYLKDAVVAVLAGKAPVIAATDAPGCVLDLNSSSSSVTSATSKVTYHNRISRILQNNCVECHRTGGVGPFRLDNYDDVKAHAGMMRKQVEREVMPPWFAAPTKDAHSPWINDRSLAPDDKRDLLAWLASDKPVGNAADASLARVFPTDWEIGQPDLIVQLPKPIAIKATGVMAYQNAQVETTLTEDKWVKGYEIQPTAREVVHHVIVRVREKGSKKKGDGDERDGFFAAYVPGNSSSIFPDGFAKKLPAGSIISFQIHYTPSGKATEDQLKMGMIFAKEPPRHMVRVTGLMNALINIPPGATNHMEVAEIKLPFDTTLMGLMPHFHVRGKAARYEATLPDGTKKVLLEVPRYDFNWQLKYQFAEPVTLPRGTRLTFSAWYDNSAGNPANPDPTKTVNWGQQTFEEMMLGYVEYYIPGQQKLAKAQ